MKARLTIMGCGNSTGVPAAGNRWGDCDPNDPKNKRTRCSVLLQTEQTNIVIDTGPDFREHMNRANLQQLDAIFYTHAHSDHMNGIDDIRPYVFRQKKLMPVYASQDTFSELEGYFPYVFHGGKIALYPPLVEKKEITAFGKPFKVNDFECIPLQMEHGSCVATGYRFGDTAYCIDFVRLDDNAISVLKGVNTWIVDAAGYHQTDNKVHANLQTIYKLNQEIGARTIILTNLSLSMDYKTLCEELPSGYIPAYDGMTLGAEFSDTDLAR